MKAFEGRVDYLQAFSKDFLAMDDMLARPVLFIFTKGPPSNFTESTVKCSVFRQDTMHVTK